MKSLDKKDSRPTPGKGDCPSLLLRLVWRRGTRPRWRFGLVCAAVFLYGNVAGCGAAKTNRTAVQGEVTLDGKPLEFASVQFIPMGDCRGPMATARVTKGQYSLPAAEGPAIGELLVQIRTDYGRLHPGEGPQQLVERYHGAPPEPIPARYHRQSVLQVTTTEGGDNKFSFHLVGRESSESP